MDDLLRQDKISAAQLPFSRAVTLPPECYTSPQWYQQEIDKIFMREWLCVGREEQVPRPGDYFRFDIVGEPLVIVRDRQGKVHAHTAVCRHRAAIIAQGTGSCRAFICPYHGWTYALSGELVNTPGASNPMQAAEGFRRDDYGLISHRLETWEGFIFVNFDPDAPSLLSWLGDLPERFANYRLGEIRFHRKFEYDVGCNWKVYFENSAENYHTSTVHREQLSGPHAPQAEFPEVKGPYFYLFLPNAISAISSFPPVQGLSEAQLHGTSFVLLQPNLLLLLTPTYVVFRQFLPQGPERVRIVHNWCFPEATTRRSDFASEVGPEYYERYTPVIQEDMDITPLVQQGLTSRFCRQGRYATEEVLLHQFAKYVSSKVFAA